MDVAFKEDESEGNQRRNQISKQDTYMVISKKMKKQGHGTKSDNAEAAALQRAVGGGLSKGHTLAVKVRKSEETALPTPRG